MSVRPNNVTVRADLTQYAFGVMQDAQAALEIAHLISPVVPTGGTSGLYNSFEETAAFKAYADAVARRSVGGHATEIGLLSETANYNAQPYGLRIKLDEHERSQAGNNLALLEQAKVRTLTISSALAYLKAVITKVDASVTATAGKGAWNNPNIDPIAEVDEQIKAVWLASGMVPNVVLFDFGAWCVFKGNKNVKSLFSGISARIQPDAVQGIFVNPNAKVRVVETAVTTGGGLGNSSATRVGALGGNVYIYYSSPTATVYDPSFMKTFSPSANLFTEVYSYREEPHFDWFENDWTCAPVVVSSSLCKSISVTGANS